MRNPRVTGATAEGVVQLNSPHRTSHPTRQSLLGLFASAMPAQVSPAASRLGTPPVKAPCGENSAFELLVSAMSNSAGNWPR